MWNVNDIFVDFFTIGNYVNLGAPPVTGVQEMTLNSEGDPQLSDGLSGAEPVLCHRPVGGERKSDRTGFCRRQDRMPSVRDDSIQKLDELLADGQFSYGWRRCRI